MLWGLVLTNKEYSFFRTVERWSIGIFFHTILFVLQLRKPSPTVIKSQVKFPFSTTRVKLTTHCACPESLIIFARLQHDSLKPSAPTYWAGSSLLEMVLMFLLTMSYVLEMVWLVPSYTVGLSFSPFWSWFHSLMLTDTSTLCFSWRTWSLQQLYEVSDAVVAQFGKHFLCSCLH